MRSIKINQILLYSIFFKLACTQWKPFVYRSAAARLW